MKKTLLLSVLLVAISLFAVAQIKMLVHLDNRPPVEYEASIVDSITFKRISKPDIPGDDIEKPGDSEIPDDPNEIVSNGHKYVDLGLPSGTLWATMNIGAKYTEDYGDAFAWGEVEPKEEYTTGNYKWSDDLEEVLGNNDIQLDSLTKYCLEPEYGIVDNKISLDLSDDAAHVNWGGDWRMPSTAEMNELFLNSQWVYDNLNGVNGIKLIGPNGNSIFLPGASYWTNSIYPMLGSNYSFASTNEKYHSLRGFVVEEHRTQVLPIRPIISKNVKSDKLGTEILDIVMDNIYVLQEREHGYIYREGFWALQENTTDECFIPTRYLGDWYDGRVFWDLHNHRWDSQTREISRFGHSGANAWGFAYKGIEQCNLAIKCAGYLPEDKLKSEDLAEVYILRAWYHYLLLDNFGNVPFISQYGVDILETPQNTRAQVFDSIMTDLLKYVPQASEEKVYTRVNKYVGWTILAKMYLNAEAWGVVGKAKYAPSASECYKLAAAYSDSIIKYGGYSLEPNYFDNFKVENQNSIENIWSIFYDARESHGMQFHMMTLHYASRDSYGLRNSPWNGYCGSHKIIGLYKDKVTGEFNDERIKCWERGQQFTKTGDSIKVKVPVDSETYKNMPKYVRKPANWPATVEEFEQLAKEKGVVQEIVLNDGSGRREKVSTVSYEFPAFFTDTITTLTNAAKYRTYNIFEGPRFVKFQIQEGVGDHMSNDFPIYRLADVYLMKAEALMRLNGGVATQEAVEIANQVRYRAGATPYTLATLTLDELCNERCRELLWEGHRRQDLIRFDRFTGHNSVQNDSDPYNLWILKYSENDHSRYDNDEGRTPFISPDYMKIFPLPDFYIEKGHPQNPGYIED